MYNKYWKISWWHIFDMFDKWAHEKAIDVIWECVTATAEIKYFQELDKMDDDVFVETVFNTEKTVIISVELVWIAIWTFTFVRKKNW